MRKKFVAFLKWLADRLEVEEGLGVHETVWGGKDGCEIIKEDDLTVQVNAARDEHGGRCIELAMPDDRYLVFSLRRVRRIVRSLRWKNA